jgi:hypothetical protein
MVGVGEWAETEVWQEKARKQERDKFVSSTITVFLTRLSPNPQWEEAIQ